MAIEAAICQVGGELTVTRTYMMMGEVKGNIESQKASGVLGSRRIATVQSCRESGAGLPETAIAALSSLLHMAPIAA